MENYLFSNNIRDKKNRTSLLFEVLFLCTVLSHNLQLFFIIAYFYCSVCCFYRINVIVFIVLRNIKNLLIYSQLSNVIITEYPYVVVLIFSDCKIESAVYLDNIS